MCSIIHSPPHEINTRITKMKAEYGDLIIVIPMRQSCNDGINFDREMNPL